MDGFNPAATAYDSRNALWLGKAAALAYDDDATVRAALSNMEVRFVTSARTDTRGYVAGNADCVVIAFRGTQPAKLKDWLTDLDALRVAGPVGEVHKGFYDGLQSVWTELVLTLHSMRLKEQPLWVAGHSLGAALATLAAARLLHDRVIPEVHGLYTFGQPRTGNRDFAAWFDGLMKPRMFRFVNNNDIVPHVPLPPLYKHCGTFLYFDSHGKLQENEGFWGELKEGLEGKVKSLCDEKLVPDEIEDHFMANYLQRLEENAG